LHEIPDLTEHFLYFNDDFFAFDTLAPADFVNENGTLNANLEERSVVNSPVDPRAPDYLNAARNAARLLFERYGYYPARLHKHAPYSLSLSLLRELEAEFRPAFNKTRDARFRSGTDINVASFMAYHYGFIKRAVVYGSYSAEHIQSNDPFSLPRLQTFARADRPPKVICINESGIPAPSKRWRRQVTNLLANKFFRPAPWERQSRFRG
jgi:hypothetical protein